jgi:hypothetical protein
LATGKIPILGILPAHKPKGRSDKLGSIYQTINWSSLIELLPKKKTMAGAPSWLPPQGYFGLMFLKHYTKLSDEKLLERFNTERSAAAVVNADVLWRITN